MTAPVCFRCASVSLKLYSVRCLCLLHQFSITYGILNWLYAINHLCVCVHITSCYTRCINKTARDWNTVNTWALYSNAHGIRCQIRFWSVHQQVICRWQLGNVFVPLFSCLTSRLSYAHLTMPNIIKSAFKGFRSTVCALFCHYSAICASISYQIVAIASVPIAYNASSFAYARAKCH